MYAVNQTGPGGPETLHWSEVETPTPLASEVLIKVHSAGVNRADLMQRKGKYPPPKDASTILGMEVSGEITACGVSVKRWKVGDKVCALLAGGGYAEYVAAPEATCLPIPPGLSLTEAAALPEGAVTVWANIFVTGDLRAGETVLIHGGSSGIGTLAIQMCKSEGAAVLVTAKTDEKCAACVKLGADLAINYSDLDFVLEIEKALGPQGVDIILDMVGGDYIPRNLSLLASDGRHVSIATQKSQTATIDLRMIMSQRLHVTGSTMRARSADQKAALIQSLTQNMWDRMGSKGIKPLIYKAYPIKDVALAHKMMESGAHIGKIVLEIAH